MKAYLRSQVFCKVTRDFKPRSCFVNGWLFVVRWCRIAWDKSSTSDVSPTIPRFSHSFQPSVNVAANLHVNLPETSLPPFRNSLSCEVQKETLYCRITCTSKSGVRTYERSLNNCKYINFNFKMYNLFNITSVFKTRVAHFTMLKIKIDTAPHS